MEGPNSSPFLAVPLIFAAVFGYLVSQPQPFHAVIWTILHANMGVVAAQYSCDSEPFALSGRTNRASLHFYRSYVMRKYARDKTTN